MPPGWQIAPDKSCWLLVSDGLVNTSRLPITNPPKLPVTPFLDNFRFADDPPDFQCAQPVDSELTRLRHPTL
jgi:hypothetical protein